MQDLHAGASGPFVTFAQLRLIARGHGPLALSGVLDAPTQAAVRALQAEFELPATGEVDGDTWAALLSAQPAPAAGPLSFSEDDEAPEHDEDAPAFEPLAEGYAGPLLLELQLRLRAAGQDAPLEDTLGPGTAAAIAAFQAAEGIPVDGRLDHEGWLTLLSASAGADLLHHLPEAELADQAGPVSFGGESRDVDGSGGYRYRQYEDGEIEILRDPSGRIQGRVLSSGRAWQAITAEIGPYPEPAPGRALVREGSRGPAARAVQARLNALGFGPIAADGIFGPASVDALRRFQKAADLDVDGVCGDGTHARLDDPWPTLAKGAKGPVVKDLQVRLTALGHPLTADGDYGDNTAAAVRAFQASKGLPATGVIDAVTRGHILGARGVSVPADLVEIERARLRTIAEARVAEAPPAARDRIFRVLQEAIATVGVRESWGPNQGPEINRITEGFPDPKAPWCALAVSWWVKQGLGARTWAEVPWGRQNASSMWFGQWGEQRGRVLPATGPAPVGAIMVMERAGSGSDASGGGAPAASRFAQRPGHTAIVLQDLGDRVVTIDGNVSDTCKACTRPKTALLGFVTWW